MEGRLMRAKTSLQESLNAIACLHSSKKTRGFVKEYRNQRIFAWMHTGKKIQATARRLISTQGSAMRLLHLMTALIAKAWLISARNATSQLQLTPITQTFVPGFPFRRSIAITRLQ